MCKKVLYVLPYSFYFTGNNNRTGGHISHIIGVIEALVKKSYEIDMVSDMQIPDFESSRIKYFKPFFFSIRKFLRKYRLSWRLGTYLFIVGLALTVWRCAKRKGISFIYVRHNLNGYIPAIVAKMTGVPLVIEVNTPVSLGVFNKPNAFKRHTVRISQRERIQYKIANVISVVSPIIRDWILEDVGLDYNNNILVNPNGVNLQRFVPKGYNEMIRKRYRIKLDNIVIGMTAGFVRYNAIEELVEAFNKALQIIPNLYLILIGDSEIRPALEKYVQDRNLSKFITFTGRIPYDEVPAYLDTCDIYVSHFNFQQSLPHICTIKHLEYLAMGRPTVATNIGYVNFAIRHKENGLLVPQSDIDGFARAIVTLATDPILRDRLGRQARRDATQYTWEANIIRILSRLKKRLSVG